MPLKKVTYHFSAASMRYCDKKNSKLMKLYTFPTALTRRKTGRLEFFKLKSSTWQQPTHHRCYLINFPLLSAIKVKANKKLVEKKVRRGEMFRNRLNTYTSRILYFFFTDVEAHSQPFRAAGQVFSNKFEDNNKKNEGKKINDKTNWLSKRHLLRSVLLWSVSECEECDNISSLRLVCHHFWIFHKKRS